MNIAEFENATIKELRQRADKCFTDASTAVNLPYQHYLLEQARFYLDEIERRENSRIARRDFRMELIVILLIALELLVSERIAQNNAKAESQYSADQVQAIGKVDDILTKLQASSDATAKTLGKLESDTEAMSGTQQKQLEMFYDVNINVTWDQTRKRLMFTNNGRTKVALWDSDIGGVFGNFEKPQLIQSNGGDYELILDPLYAEWTRTIPKGSTVNQPLTLRVENDKREKFTVTGNLTLSWDGDTLNVNTGNNSLTPGWSKKAK